MSTSNKLSSEERYANSNRAASVSAGPGMQYTSNRPYKMQRTAGQGAFDEHVSNRHVRQMQPQPTDIDPATTARSRAIKLVQDQEDGLTTAQKIALIRCFMEDAVVADTYIMLTDPEVRQGWILEMLMK